MEPSPPRPRLRDRIAAAYPQMLLIAERVVHRRTQAAARAKVCAQYLRPVAILR